MSYVEDRVLVEHQILRTFMALLQIGNLIYNVIKSFLLYKPMDFGIRSMARLERCISLTPIHPARSYSRKHRQACVGVWNLDYEQQQMYLTLDEESETSESKSSQLPEPEQLDLPF